MIPTEFTTTLGLIPELTTTGRQLKALVQAEADRYDAGGLTVPTPAIGSDVNAVMQALGLLNVNGDLIASNVGTFPTGALQLFAKACSLNDEPWEHFYARSEGEL